ncbi:hypothetical protein JB92DRAFT_3104484 [Gautieria morchelliformis]|nr:hypothetical protein JB92DRAFT_3104484 [Gautieria morchelliformis]
MALPSFTSTLLDESLHPDAKIDKETVQNTAAMAYAAGAALHPPSSLYPLNIYHRCALLLLVSVYGASMCLGRFMADTELVIMFDSGDTHTPSSR